VRDAGLFSTRRDRLAPRGRPPHRTLERFLHRTRRLRLSSGRPGEKLVGSRAHRLKDQVGFRGRGNGEDGDRRIRRAQPLDGGHAGRRVGADVQDDGIGARPFGTPFDDADGDAARPKQTGDVAFEFLVVTDNRY
jgi:hypothetical protein